VPQTFRLYGAGWGHGVGMCQIGAAAMTSPRPFRRRHSRPLLQRINH